MNLKLTLLALVATIGFGAATVAANAAATTPTPPTIPGCTVDCDGDEEYGGNDEYDPFCMFEPCKSEEGSTPEEDKTPTAECDDLAPCGLPDPDCQIDCVPGKDGGLPGGGIPGNKAGLKLCDAQIGDLKKVTAKQIKGISGRDEVQVVAVCVDKNLVEQQQGVENIRSAIAQNDNMDAALGQQGLGADDVVGVVVGRTQAVLYVHAL